MHIKRIITIIEIISFIFLITFVACDSQKIHNTECSGLTDAFHCEMQCTCDWSQIENICKVLTDEAYVKKIRTNYHCYREEFTNVMTAVYIAIIGICLMLCVVMIVLKSHSSYRGKSL